MTDTPTLTVTEEWAENEYLSGRVYVADLRMSGSVVTRQFHNVEAAQRWAMDFVHTHERKPKVWRFEWGGGGAEYDGCGWKGGLT